MPAPVVALIDLSHPFNAVGEPLPLLHPATSELSFLSIFLGQCRQVKGVDAFYAVVRESDLEKFKKELDGFTVVKVPDAKDGYFYEAHQHILNSRKWCHQTIAGGLNDLTVYDEILPTDLIKQMADKMEMQALLHLHPSFVMFDPDYASQLITVAKQDEIQGDPPMIIRQTMLGLCPALVTKTGLRLLKENKHWLPVQVLRGDCIGDGLMVMNGIVRHDLGPDIMRGNLMLSTKRDCIRLRKVLHFLMATDKDPRAESIHTVLLNYPEILSESFPREVEIETAGCASEMSPYLFESVYAQCCNEPDCRVTITPEGIYQDLMIEEVKKRKPYGLNIVLTYGALTGYPDTCKAWLDAKPDMVTVKTCPLSEDVTAFAPYLGEFVRKAHECDVLVHVELTKTDRNWRAIHQIHEWSTTMRFSYNWVAGDPRVLPYVPLDRTPCEKVLYQMTVLCDGRVVQCGRCWKHVLGDANRNKLKEIWESWREVRRDCTKNLKPFPPCADCTEWLST